MSTSILTTPNTSPTPDQAGSWVVSKFGPPSVLKWQTWEPTTPLDGEKVLVRIIAAGIAGVDNIQRVGGYPHPKATEPGFTLGYDLVGEVIAMGDTASKASKLKIGDRVAALSMFGAHATHIELPHTELMQIEKSDDPIKITALPLNYMTAWGMLKEGGIQNRPGSSILIGSAAGGLGTAVAQLVKAFNINVKMIGTCSPSKFEYIRSLGIQPVDRHAPDLADKVRALTNGEGVDVAYDAVGSADSIEKSLAATKADVGKVIMIGVMGEIASDGSGIARSGAEIIAERTKTPRTSFWILDTAFPTKPEVADFYAIVEKVRSGLLDPVIAKLLPLRDAVKAHELLIDGSASKGKMVFIVDAELAAQHGL